MSKPTPDDLRQWADHPAASGMVPVHPETLRWLAARIRELEAAPRKILFECDTIEAAARVARLALPPPDRESNG